MSTRASNAHDGTMAIEGGSLNATEELFSNLQLFLDSDPDAVSSRLFVNHPWDKIPSHYGGGNREMDFHLSFLPRVHTLPPPKKKWRIGKSPRVEALFKKLYNGDFLFRFLEVPKRAAENCSFTPRERPLIRNGACQVEGCCRCSGRKGTIAYIISIFESGESSDPAAQLILSQDPDKLINLKYNNYSQTAYDFFYEALPLKEGALLSTRLIHIILRHQGALIPNELATCMKEALFRLYSTDETLVDAKAFLDIAICYADIFVSTQKADQLGIALALRYVGTGLRAEGHLQTAADVYERAIFLSDTDMWLQSHLWKGAGMAWQRDEQYAKAERAYYHAMHLQVVQHGNQLPLEDEDFADLVYYSLGLGAKILLLPVTTTRLLNDMEKRGEALTTLIQKSGFHIEKIQEMLKKPFFEQRSPSIKPPLLTPIGARVALTVAILKPSFEGYCIHLLNCHKDTVLMWKNQSTRYPSTIKPQDGDCVNLASETKVEQARQDSLHDATRVQDCSNRSCFSMVEKDGNGKF